MQVQIQKTHSEHAGVLAETSLALAWPDSETRPFLQDVAVQHTALRLMLACRGIFHFSFSISSSRIQVRGVPGTQDTSYLCNKSLHLSFLQKGHEILLECRFTITFFLFSPLSHFSFSYSLLLCVNMEMCLTFTRFNQDNDFI